MPLKKIALLITICLIPIDLHAKEASSPCMDNQGLCPNLSEAMRTKPDLTAVNFERVVDGDTFVASGKMIRIWGIDAPEREDPAYRISGWLLKSLLEEKNLKCRFITIDKYKRDVMQGILI